MTLYLALCSVRISALLLSDASISFEPLGGPHKNQTVSHSQAGNVQAVVPEDQGLLPRPHIPSKE